MITTNLLDLTIRAAIEAGEGIMTIYNDPNSDFGIERKSDNSPLTIADKKSNEIIMRFLDQTEFPVLSEEGRSIPYAERKDWNTLWIVDPLDGTKEFIKKNGEFTVNIALVTNGKPVLGVIYLPVKRILYFGSADSGSYRLDIQAGEVQDELSRILENAKKLPLAQEDRPFRIVASRSHCSDETKSFIEELEKEHGKAELVSSGSSIKICMVAEGTADIYPRFAPTMEWDTAAGHAIALYAGKQIYKQNNTDPVIYNKEDLLNPYFIVR
ncbi:MAG: 3'(2'),5'-bisphosphate nucleotidase CysQ [Bacteroidales bacterium]